jgi:glycosyltransferase involved in cell wall biosynthesis
MRLDRSTVLYVTHSLTSSPKEEWITFLKSHCRRLICLDHPFSYKRGDIRSSVTVFEGGRVASRSYVSFPRGASELLFYAKDVVLNLLWGASHGRIDLAIATDPLNTFSLLPLRKIGLTRKLAYYVIDYVPERFPSRLRNSIYHAIDRACCRNVDIIWNLSPRMMEGRAANGLRLVESAPWLVVPMGVDLSRVRPLGLDEIQRHTVVYMGALLRKQGIHLALDVMPEVRRQVPDLKFVIVGVGEYESELKRRVAGLNLEDVVDFRGYIEDHEEVERLLCRCAIGLAPYEIDSGNYTYYTDAGKPKVYLGCGLPVVITRVPLIAYEIEEKRAGLVIEYTAEALRDALLRLLLDEALYAELRENAIAMSRKYQWSRICAEAVRATGYEV